MTLRTLMEFERKGWSRKWSWINKWILSAISLLWLVVSVFFAYLGWFKEPRLAWLALFGLIYLGVGFGARVTIKEWKEETLYWWLSLPAPREKLLLAKGLVALQKWLRIFGIAFVYLALYMFLLDWTNGVLTWTLFLSQLQIGFTELLLAIALGPFLVMVGMLLGSFKKSNSRFVVALLWGLVISVLNFQVSLLGLKVTGKEEPLSIVTNINYTGLLVEGIVAYGLAVLIFKFMVHRLKQGKMLTSN